MFLEILEFVAASVAVAVVVTVVFMALSHGPLYYREELVDKTLKGVVEQEGQSDSLKGEAKFIIEHERDYAIMSDWIRRNQGQFPGELQKTARRAVIMDKVCRVYYGAMIAFVVASAIFGIWEFAWASLA